MFTIGWDQVKGKKMSQILMTSLHLDLPLLTWEFRHKVESVQCHTEESCTWLPLQHHYKREYDNGRSKLSTSKFSDNPEIYIPLLKPLRHCQALWNPPKNHHKRSRRRPSRYTRHASLLDGDTLSKIPSMMRSFFQRIRQPWSNHQVPNLHRR